MGIPSGPTNECLRRAVEAHFDPANGSPYWLDRQAELGVHAIKEIREVSDVGLLGPFEKNALIERPIEDFIPRNVLRERSGLILGESGGTTGRPVRSVFSTAEFEEGFGAPYMAVSRARGFPRGGNWLFVGPSGPHIIARAARLLARLHESLEPFSVDLDPRWARSQSPGSLGSKLYHTHVLNQALDILAREKIEVFFITPPLALELGESMPEEQRAAIRGIHLGGMALRSEDYSAIREKFGEAVVLPGYGNSLFGLLIEPREPTLSRDGELFVDYHPLPGRLWVSVVEERKEGPDLSSPVDVGERGRVVMSRFDASFFIPNFIERDRATRIMADPEITALGLASFGVRDPEPVVPEEAVHGIY